MTVCCRVWHLQLLRHQLTRCNRLVVVVVTTVECCTKVGYIIIGLIVYQSGLANMVYSKMSKSWYHVSTLQRLKAVLLSLIAYRVRQNKISQHENCHISEMSEYFCAKFRSFVWHSTACALAYCFVLYLLDIRQIDGNANFKNEFHNWSNWATSTTWLCCDVIISMFTCNIAHNRP